MATTTFTLSNPPLLPNPTNLHRHNHHTTAGSAVTVLFLKPLPLRPLHLTKTHSPSLKKPYLLKPKATLLLLSQLPSLTPPLPTKETLNTLLEVSKTIAVKLVTSIHEFKEPLIAVASAVGKWVDLYHSVLIVRILLSWFPNMPWEKQPFSAIRDLCDPCLNFFRTIMPPSANSKKIDFSPLLAFAVLGVLGSFLKSNIPPPV